MTIKENLFTSTIATTIALLINPLFVFAEYLPSTSSSELNPSLSYDSGDSFQPPPSFTVAQLIPAYKIALRKKMFEISGGFGHIDASESTNSGQASYIRSTPQTDFFPMTIAYGIGDNTTISVSGKVLRKQDTVSRSSIEGYTEPQFSLAHTFRNANSAIHLIGSYSPDIGPQSNKDFAATRTEGNALAGGASAEFTGGYFFRMDPVILGGELSYLYKDTRTVNRTPIALFTGQPAGETQILKEGGNEKTMRGIVEVALPYRIGFMIGRTWIEQEESIPLYQLTHEIFNSYYRNFLSGYGRIQVNPRLSVVPFVSYSESPDTTGLTSKSDQEVTTQVSLRYRF